MNTEGKEPAIGQLCDSQKHPEQAKPQGRPARVHGFLRRDGKAKELVSRDLNTTVEAWGALGFVLFCLFFLLILLVIQISVGSREKLVSEKAACKFSKVTLITVNHRPKA